MDVLRKRIARALWENRYPGVEQAGPLADLALADADAVIAALEMEEVATIAWDGEPSMSGRPHRMSLGADHILATLRRAIIEVDSVKFKPGARIERRFVTPWERIEDDA